MVCLMCCVGWLNLKIFFFVMNEIGYGFSLRYGRFFFDGDEWKYE